MAAMTTEAKPARCDRRWKGHKCVQRRDRDHKCQCLCGEARG